MRNQRKDKNRWKRYLGSYFLVVLVAITIGAFKNKEISTARAQTIISPIANTSVLEVVITPTPPMAANGVGGGIQKEIRSVFGKHADKALLLLSCENRSLNPKAVNDNTTWGGVGQDIGIFQINTKWQGVSNRAFLEDPSINIRIAYNIFVRSGYSFKLWACAEKVGLN